MNLTTDRRIVMTLDAGGTNFVFNAIRGGEEMFEPFRLKAKGATLEEVLLKIIDGFNNVKSALDEKPSTISFCFPGPADYPRGIIGDLENLPTFRGGVALKDMLEEKFGIPVFINNDGDLFAYGEAIGGILPEINARLEAAGNPRRYRNLFGVTFGTGFGGGIVNNGQLFIGDNSAGGEVNRMRNRLYLSTSAEDSTAIRGVRRVYARETGIPFEESPNPKEIQDIILGSFPGNKEAALKAWEEMAVVAGDTLANAITLIDGIIVIGGGLSGAHGVFLQRLVDEMNASFTSLDGHEVPRLEITALNLENPVELAEFLENKSIEIKVPFSQKTVNYNPARYIGVGVSRLGTSRAVSVGAYAYALAELDKI
ncbi:MAG TPA: ROK family protein [Bacteroidales bacterium]|nr:ROK family protein [Bacteroidales bacterium]HPI85182.1 ROK family protein [Bacteroidales bacterium]